VPGILERFQSLLARRAPQNEAERLLAELQDEIRENGPALDVSDYTGLRAIHDAAPELQRDVLLTAVAELGDRPVLGGSFWWRYHLPRLCNTLLGRQLPLDTAQLATLIRGASSPLALRELAHGSLLKQVERAGSPPTGDVLDALRAFDVAADRELKSTVYKKLSVQLEPLIGQKPMAAIEDGGAFSEAVFERLAKLPPGEAQAWHDLLKLGFTATGARPTKKWSEQMRAAVDRIGEDAFITHAREYLALGPTPGGTREAYVPETDAPYLRGLVFAAGVAKAAPLASEVGSFAAACFRKIPNRGPVHQGAGNACLWTLGEIGLDGVGQLGRLKMRVKYVVALRLIDKALTDAASRAGLSPEDLEEIGVPTCDLDEHSRYEDAHGRIEVTPESEIIVTPQKSKELKPRVKDLEAMLAAQKLRLERLFLGDRAWPFTTFSSRFLNHPLLQTLTRRLIWTAEGKTFTWTDGRLVNARGEPVQPAPGDVVTLWHPLDVPDDGWKLASQPFKQIGRETFEVTERVTMRFSGRQVPQHRFAALCRERGWTYRLQGEFDSMNDATFTLPRWGLTAQLGVAPGPAGSSRAGIFLEVEIGELTFDFTGARPPRRVISEVMRDASLFIQE
jgi:hypothetical protein